MTPALKIAPCTQQVHKPVFRLQDLRSRTSIKENRFCPQTLIALRIASALQIWNPLHNGLYSLTSHTSHCTSGIIWLDLYMLSERTGLLCTWFGWVNWRIEVLHDFFKFRPLVICLASSSLISNWMLFIFSRTLFQYLLNYHITYSYLNI